MKIIKRIDPITILLTIIIFLSISLNFVPETNKEPEKGTIQDAYNEYIANKKAYAAWIPCLRPTGIPPCYRPQNVTPCPLPR